MKFVLIFLGLMLATILPAQAFPHHHRYFHYASYHYSYHYRYTNYSSGMPSDCPRGLWCGCYLRHLLGIADTSYNLAANWLRWGRPHAGPCAGCVAVSHHHVGLIVGQQNGQWIVKQGNPLRYGPDRLAWAVAFRSPN